MSEEKQQMAVYCLQEYRVRENGETKIKTSWTRIGMGYLNRDGISYNCLLNALPVPDPTDGRVKIHIRPFVKKDSDSSASPKTESAEEIPVDEIPAFALGDDL